MHDATSYAQVSPNSDNKHTAKQVSPSSDNKAKRDKQVSPTDQNKQVSPNSDKNTAKQVSPNSDNKHQAMMHRRDGRMGERMARFYFGAKWSSKCCFTACYL